MESLDLSGDWEITVAGTEGVRGGSTNPLTNKINVHFLTFI